MATFKHVACMLSSCSCAPAPAPTAPRGRVHQLSAAHAYARAASQQAHVDRRPETVRLRCVVVGGLLTLASAAAVAAPVRLIIDTDLGSDVSNLISVCSAKPPTPWWTAARRICLR